MSAKPLKVLKNVFLPAGENSLKFADILFSDHIEAIIDRSPAPVEWKAIDSPGKRERFILQLPVKEYSPGIKIYDGEFLLAIPGGIDSHVHFDTPGFEEREDFEHGSHAAAYGGTTTVIDMPCTSLPPVTDSKNFEFKLNALKNHSLVDYCFYGGVCGNDFDSGLDVEKQVKALSENGVAGFKVYLISGMKTFTDLNEQRILHTANWVKKVNRPMFVHAEDKKMILERMAADTGKSWQDYCSARDVQAEAKAIKLMVDVADKTGCPIHIVHLSSKSGLDLIREAQSKGLKITSETCPHYLYFTQKDFNNPAISAYLKTAPPVKDEIDREALWQGLKDETLSFVTTDHAGCDPVKEKSSDDFSKIYGGIPGVEHRVPFLFSEGFLKNRLTLSETVNLLASNAADYFNLKGKGYIKDGYDSDLALIDLWNKQEIRSEDMHCKGKYTPFEGIIFNAVVRRTFLRGELIMNRSGTTEQKMGYGKFIGISY